VIATKIADEYGIIARTVSVESKNKPPSALKTYEAILRFYEYDQTFTAESFMRAMNALRHFANIEPACGLVWSLLARLYAHIYSLDFPGSENPLEKTIEYAEKGAHLHPNNQRTVAILALVRFYSNELSSALKEVYRALELNPNSLFVLDGLAYIMALSGEWGKGTALIRKIFSLNPFYRTAVHYALWVDWLRQKNYDRAHLKTMGLKRPAVFWYPLAKASTLGLLGRYEEAEKFVKTCLISSLISRAKAGF
jgi:tetratricopeptide (TPR) repeat protein